MRSRAWRARRRRSRDARRLRSVIRLGGVAWIVAIVAAVLAYRSAGAPVPVLVLLGLSVFVAFHDPPIGPIALLCFAGAVALIARAQRAPTVSAPALAGDA